MTTINSEDIRIVKVVTEGPQGPRGLPGEEGPAGIGSAWRQGAGVPSSGIGAVGDYFLNTSNGDIYGPKTAGGWGSVIFNIAQGQTGPQGPAGAAGAAGPAGVDGRTLLSGTSAPSNSVGANGDFFINTAASIIYGPKTAGAWPAGVSLIGPAGATGSQGPAGAAGAPGANGREVQLQTSATHVQWRYVGDTTWTNLVPLTEITGPQGAAGATGATGQAGANGQNIELQSSATHIQWRVVGATSWIDLVTLASLTGPAGATGPQGPAGADGRTLLSGTSAPGGGTGSDGDFFINTAASIIYGPKAGSVWPAGVTLIGPAGATGATGPTGPAGAAASVNVGTVTTGAPGSPATVTNTGTSSAAVLAFSIPRGDTGATGPAGSKGDPGADGAAATVAVGSVTTGAAGSNASVTNTGSSSAAVLDFTIPRGDTGATGAAGPAGTAATIAVGTVNTGPAGSSVSVSNAGTSSAAVLNFTIPRGDKGDKGDPGNPAPGTDITYDAATREVRSSTGTDATLPLVSSTTAGLAPASGGGSTNFLRADGTWAAPAGGGAATNLGYVTASRLLTSSTGTGVALPLATTADAGLMAASDKAKVDGAASIALSAALSIALG